MNYSNKNLGFDPITIVTGIVEIGKGVLDYNIARQNAEAAENNASAAESIGALRNRYLMNVDTTPSTPSPSKMNTTTYIAIGAAALISIIALSH
jgi:hypothetical protein